MKGRGYILVSHARHVRAGVGKLDGSPFLIFQVGSFLAFGPVRVNSAHFSIPGIFDHFLRIFRHFLKLFKTYKTK